MRDEKQTEQDNKFTLAFENVRSICQSYLEHYYSCAPDPYASADAIMETLEKAELVRE